MELDDFLDKIEKDEKERERVLKAKRISFLRKLGNKLQVLKLSFLVSLVTKLSNKAEYYYGIVYEHYYQIKYRRAITRLKLLSGIMKVIREQGKAPKLVEVYEETKEKMYE
jgi:16S rRNA G527 N7-methylase RsmG